MNILIVHYNTPELTNALIRSINKYHPYAKIYLFDNSDERPYDIPTDNLIYLDNTKGQLINFDEWLAKYPRHTITKEWKINKAGSAKHCKSVETFIELTDEPFVLLDSDVLIKQPFDDLYDENYIWVGDTKLNTRHNIWRCVPFILYINVPMLKAHNIHFCNEKLMHGLNTSVKGEKYDTGASFYYDTKDYPSRTIDHTLYVEHFRAGSWHNHKWQHQLTQEEWLNTYKYLYE